MSRWLLSGGAVIVASAAVLLWRASRPASTEPILISKAKPPEAAPACPWREPDQDLKQFFPEAHHYEIETISLSGLRLELAARLGRPLEPDENLLRIYRIYGTNGHLGNVVPRRVKGAYGAIEVILATDLEDKVSGLRLQRMREPEDIVAALNDPAWLKSFVGKTDAGDWQIGREIPNVRSEAQASASAIAEGVHSVLVLLQAADHSARAKATLPHHTGSQGSND